MVKQVLFIQGAGAGAYDADKKLANSLQRTLGSDYDMRYPRMPDEDNAPYEEWKQQVETEMATMSGPVLLVGHSVGASILAKCLIDSEVDKPVAGIFLISTPFWGGDGWWYEGIRNLSYRAILLQNCHRALWYFCTTAKTMKLRHLATWRSMQEFCLRRQYVRSRVADISSTMT